MNGRADITLIYKNGNKEEILNHRLVSLTSIVCKMCEKLPRNNERNTSTGKKITVKPRYNELIGFGDLMLYPMIRYI